MAANDLTFEQCATLLNDVSKQVTGKESQAAVNTSGFIIQAIQTLKTGYDPVLGAISQTIARTVFSTRPYEAKFKGLMKTEQQWGGHTRKINYYDKDFEDNQEFKLNDGEAIDQYKINKPGVIQTNFYGQQTFAKSMTVFKDQINSAFNGPAAFGEFMSGAYQNVNDQIEQVHETMGRLAVINFMMAKYKADTPNVINLLTEYNAYTGESFTAADVKKPANYPGFVKFAYARMKTIAQLMSERTVKFHMNFTKGAIQRHTPNSKLKMYVLNDNMNQIETQVLSSVYNPEFLKVVDYEGVNFWQSIDKPDTINIQANYINASGDAVNMDSAEELTGVFGLMFDEEAIGQTTTNRSADVTPYNAGGKYWNTFWHFTERYWNDLTENGVLFIVKDA